MSELHQKLDKILDSLQCTERPSVLYKPTISLDGNGWVALRGWVQFGTLAHKILKENN